MYGVQQPAQGGRKPQRQLILLIDASAWLSGDIRTQLIEPFLKKFDEVYSEPGAKNIDYCMILYRGYPNGSSSSVECTERTQDLQFLLHWLQRVKFEGGGSRYHALAEGLHCASQYCTMQTKNHVIVVTGSEYSQSNCTTSLASNCNVHSILVDMTRNKNAFVSLLSNRKIESLRKLWFSAIGENNLQVDDLDTRLLIFHGLENLRGKKAQAQPPTQPTPTASVTNVFPQPTGAGIITKMFRYKIDETVLSFTCTVTIAKSPTPMTPPQQWPASMDVCWIPKNLGPTFTEILPKVTHLALGQVNDETSLKNYALFAKYMQEKEVLGWTSCVPGENLLIYNQTKGLAALQMHSPDPSKLQNQKAYTRPAQ